MKSNLFSLFSVFFALIALFNAAPTDYYSLTTLTDPELVKNNINKYIFTYNKKQYSILNGTCGGSGCFFQIQNGKEIKAFKATKWAIDPENIQEIKQEMDKKPHPNVLRLYDVVVLPAKNLLIVL